MKTKLISIIVPIFNEENFIEIFLNTLKNNILYLKKKKNKTFNYKFELIFIDGNSEDNTNKILKEYLNKNFINLNNVQDFKILFNKKRFVPYSMNIGISSSNGEIIIRLDSHCRYPDNYLYEILKVKEETNADNVGTTFIPIINKENLVQYAIALTNTHSFGVGNSKHKTVKDINDIIEVDTVPFGCYDKKIFDKIGLYDEELIRNQDDELNARLRKNGGKILLIPYISFEYSPRKSFKSLFRQFFQYGLFKPLVSLKIGHFTSIRQLIPLFFVLNFLLFFISFFISKPLFIFSSFLIILYLLLNFYFSLKISIKEKKLKLLPFITFSFFIMHFSYGLGYLIGTFKVLKKLIIKK